MTKYNKNNISKFSSNLYILFLTQIMYHQQAFIDSQKKIVQYYIRNIKKEIFKCKKNFFKSKNIH